MTIDLETFQSEVERLGPFESRQHAERAIASTLRALRSLLLEDEAAWLAKALGPRWGAELQRGRFDERASAESMLEQASRIEAGSPGIGREHAQVVCAELGRYLPPAVQRRLIASLPALADLLTAPLRPPSRPPPAHGSHGDHNLAAGHPGGAHPLSESKPRPAHQHSVARSDDPHWATRISSAPGIRPPGAAPPAKSPS